MTYGSEENKQAIQELATLVDAAVARWSASHSLAAVEVQMTAAMRVAPGSGIVDVSTFFGSWDNTSEVGEGWARGSAARQGVGSAPNRAQRRASGRGN